MTKPAGIFAALTLLVLSTAGALILLEVGLRLSQDPSDLFSPLVTVPERNQRHNEARFWQRYSDQPDVAFNNFDPVLGWDAGPRETRVRDRVSIPATEGLRMVAVGDSFVFGNDVGPEENFPARLERNWHIQVLNMGVPGYGIDQSFLKYREHGAAYQPDVVLFGIFLPDYVRSSLSFTAFAKPRFVQKDDAIHLENQPVPHPRVELERIGQELDGIWYLPTLLEDLLQRGKHPDRDFLLRMDAVVEHILASLKADLADGQELLVIHIPRGEAFSQPDPAYHQIHQHLLTIYQRLEVPHIDLYAAFTERDDANVLDQFYVRRPSGRAGHWNPAGHEFVAAAIADRLGLDRR